MITEKQVMPNNCYSRFVTNMKGKDVFSYVMRDFKDKHERHIPETGLESEPCGEFNFQPITSFCFRG